MFTFGDFDGFVLVRHQHETGAKNDDIKLLIGMVFVQIIKVHVLNLDIIVFGKEFLTGWYVAAVDINTKDLCVFEAVDDAFERVACCGSDVEYLFDWFFGFEGPFANSFISDPSIEIEYTW